MALDLTGQLCAIINADLDQTCIPLPGGGEICYHPGIGNIPVPSDICADLLPRLQVSLAVLAPLMCIVDVAISMVKVHEAVVDAIGPPPDPTILAQRVAELLETMMCLLPLIPQLSICPLIKALLDIIINCLIDIREQLTNIISLNVGIANGRARSAALGGVALLDAALDCAEENISLLEAAMAGSMESIQRLLDVTVNPLMEIAQLQPISTDDLQLSEGAPDEIIEALDISIQTMLTIRDALPC